MTITIATVLSGSISVPVPVSISVPSTVVIPVASPVPVGVVVPVMGCVGLDTMTVVVIRVVPLPLGPSLIVSCIVGARAGRGMRLENG